ncbi:ComEA family DNA-binding protein [Tumebacillus sp. BK434]|uniref:ComEA family DNA-binding protein n=1 Tax=Tumebacillus sp. BK434 TaxID=2512169 RepID=UPI001FB26F8B|nr:ComEA family DNA-binding protein [Tumebacillus sp. BK434]
MQKKERTLLLVLLIGILLAGSVYLYGGQDDLQAAQGVVLDQEPAQQPAQAAGKIKVHVKGAVNSPGVYQLPAGSRVIDAIEAAGGSKAGAQLDEINLAQALTDGGQVSVPDQPAEGKQAADQQSAAQAGKINLNTATLDQLDTLPGIGTIRAQAILDHRQSHGRFFQVDDLKQVSGLSAKLIDGLRDKVYVE